MAMLYKLAHWLAETLDQLSADPPHIPPRPHHKVGAATRGAMAHVFHCLPQPIVIGE